MDMRNFVKLLAAIFVAGALLRFGNENYEMLKADFGLLAPIACLIGGAALIVYGIKSFGQAFSR